MAYTSEEEGWIRSLKAAGFAVDGIDWRDKEEMNIMYQTLSISSASEKTKLKSVIRRYEPPVPVYKITARIGNARNVKGFRASVYEMAEGSLGHSSPGDEKSIRYGRGTGEDGDADIATLIVSVYFKTESSALEFAAKLRNFKFHHPLASSQLEEPQVDRTPRLCPGRDDLQPILLRDYDASEAEDSPCTSLAHFRGLPTSLPTEPVALVEPLYKYQSIESDATFVARNPYKLHIKDKSRFRALRDNENNMFAGSWTFHQLFDGLNTTEGHLIPLMAIKWIRCDSNATSFLDGESRFKVELQIEFFTEAAETDLKGSLKQGSTRVSEKKWGVFVHVSDPKTFKECIDWKYEQAVQIWNDHLLD